MTEQILNGQAGHPGEPIGDAPGATRDEEEGTRSVPQAGQQIRGGQDGSDSDADTGSDTETDGVTPREPAGHDMADVIEGPVGFASMVPPDRIPDRLPTAPELGPADDAEGADPD